MFRSKGVDLLPVIIDLSPKSVCRIAIHLAVSVHMRSVSGLFRSYEFLTWTIIGFHRESWPSAMPGKVVRLILLWTLSVSTNVVNLAPLCTYRHHRSQTNESFLVEFSPRSQRILSWVCGYIFLLLIAVDTNYEAVISNIYGLFFIFFVPPPPCAANCRNLGYSFTLLQCPG